MPDFIENPRRAPRAPVRCDARVALAGGGYWTGPTTDYGPHGCQLVSPTRLEPGQRIFLELVNERVEGQYRLSGRVAWASNAAPWRTGVAFDDGAVSTARDFFTRLAAAFPGLDTFGRAPDRIAADAPLAPAPPPALDPALLAEEVTVLEAVGEGAAAGAITERLGPDRLGPVNALFALLGRGYLVVGAPDAPAAAAWAALLARRGGEP